MWLAPLQPTYIYCKQDALSLERYSVIKDRRFENHSPACSGRAHSRGAPFNVQRTTCIATHDSSGRRRDSRENKQWTWWSWTGSNRRPQACKARALPAELQPPFPVSRKRSRKTSFEVKTDPTGFHVESTITPPSIRPSNPAGSREAGKVPLSASRDDLADSQRAQSANGGPGWTRTTDLPLIRRTL
jgi:hypothetical protein